MFVNSEGHGSLMHQNVKFQDSRSAVSDEAFFIYFFF